MADVEIRDAQRAEVAAIVALLADDPLGATRERVGDGLAPSYLAAFEAIERDPNQDLLVGVQGDEVVATLQLTYLPGLTYGGGWRGQIEAVRVARSLRGAGLGRRLIDAALERARGRGCHLVQLTTDKARPEALRFYASCGFVASHEGMKLHFERD